jgi:hypothetical protein
MEAPSYRAQVAVGGVQELYRFDLSYDRRPRFFFRMRWRGLRPGADASRIFSAGKSRGAVKLSPALLEILRSTASAKVFPTIAFTWAWSVLNR